MALPTISNNSPSAGYISWTAFGIQYDGVAYPVAASNTNTAFVIWQYNGGSPTILKTNTFPAGLTADDQILFLNKGGVGALVPMTDVLDGSLVVPGSIIANSIAANAIQSYHVNANAITAIQIQANVITSNEIASNAITGDELAVNVVTTEHLGVGSVGNSLVANGYFEEIANGVPTGWLGDATATNGTMTAVTGVATSGNTAVRLTCPAVTDKIFLKQTAPKYIPVTATAGRKWYISAKIGAGAPLTRGLYFRAIWYNAAKGYLSYTNLTTEAGTVLSNVGVTTTFDDYEGQVTPPANARYMSVEVSLQLPDVAGANVYVDEVMAREVVVSAVIGDGQISTPKIMTNAVVANHIGANIIQGNHIAANAITTDKLLVSDFTSIADGGNFDVAADLDNYTITGAGVTITTSAPQAGSGALQVAANAAIRTLTMKNKPTVKAGEKFWVSYWFKSTADWNGQTGNSKLRFGDATNANLGQVTHGPASTTWVERTQEFTVAAGVTNLTLALVFDHTVGTAWIDGFTMRRMNSGELIVDGSIVTTHMKSNSINANVLTVNSITTNLIGANQITTTSLGANAVTSNEIAANVITGKHIGAGSIAANKLIVGSGVNALPDPSFLIPDLLTARLTRSTGGVNGWTVGAPTVTGIPSVSRLTTGTSDAFHYAPVNPTGANAGSAIKVSEGQKWRMEVEVGTDISAGVRWNFYAYKADGTVATYSSLSSYSTAIGRRVLGHTYTVPAGVVAIDLAVACNLAGVNFTVYGGAIVALQTSTTLIEDGAITTNQIAANSINANRLVSNSITGVQINANAINGMKITGATIVGGEVKTTETTGAVTGRMGPASAWDPLGGAAVTGIGFAKIGTNDTEPAGMYSKDGHTLWLTQSHSGGAGGSTIMLGDDLDGVGSGQKINIKSWGATSIDARGGIDLYSSMGGVTVQGVSLDPLTKSQVTWTNGWTNFGSGYGNMQAKEIMPGVVLMEGMAKPGTKSGGIAIFTLPVGLRPNRIHNVPCVVRTSLASPDANSPGMLQVNTTGVVQLHCDLLPSAVYAIISATFFLDSP